MPIYLLSDEPYFPDPNLAREDGLLAIEGDLHPERLIQAYAKGIFPWYADGEPILWWSPNPRMVLFPKDFKRHKSLRRKVEKDLFEVTFDTAFDEVIHQCARTRQTDESGTWITKEMIEAYVALHKMGLAHSVEAWQEGKLVGGLYGVSLGGTFFGESMFYGVTDASKVALWHLVDRLLSWNFDMIDAQQETTHLSSLGAVAVERKKFLHLLNKSLDKPTKQGRWTNH